MKKTLFLSALLVCSMAFFTSYAALNSIADVDQTIMYSDGSCKNAPMFRGSGNLAPGDECNGSIGINNNRQSEVSVIHIGALQIDDSETKNPNRLLNNLHLTVREGTLPVLSKTYYDGTLGDFVKNGIDLAADPIKLDPGEQLDLNYDVSFGFDAGNECQGTVSKVMFDAEFRWDDEQSDYFHGGHDSQNYSDVSGIVTAAVPNEQTLAPIQPEIDCLVPVQAAIEPVTETVGELPQTGWTGMLGGGTAALLMAGAGWALRQIGKRGGR